MINNNFKIGDKVKIKKLSYKEWKTVYLKEGKQFGMQYNKEGNPLAVSYLKFFKKYFNKIGIISTLFITKCILFINEEYIDFYLEEVEPVYDIKTKINFVKEIIKKIKL